MLAFYTNLKGGSIGTSYYFYKYFFETTLTYIHEHLTFITTIIEIYVLVSCENPIIFWLYLRSSCVLPQAKLEIQLNVFLVCLVEL